MAKKGTQLSNVSSMYGHKYNIAFTSLDGNDILTVSDINGNIIEDNLLAPHSIVISAPAKSKQDITDTENYIYDLGSYCLFASDADGYPVRLTYTIKEGNGLNSHDSDFLQLDIDNKTIKVNSSEELYIEQNNIIDNNTIQVVNNVMQVETNNLQKTKSGTYGIARGDGKTIITEVNSDGILSVNTKNLDYADDTSSRSGIVRGFSDIDDISCSKTIKITQGNLSVITEHLNIPYYTTTADKERITYNGVVSPDYHTLTVDNVGKMSVITQGLSYATETTHGIVKPDNNTIKVINGELSVIGDKIGKASDTVFGVVKIDPDTLEINEHSGALTVKNFGNIMSVINNFDYVITNIKNTIIDIKNTVIKIETASEVDIIYEFAATGEHMFELSKPLYLESTNSIGEVKQTISVVYAINTNCKFSISVQFEENISPAVTLQSVRFGSDSEVSAEALHTKEFNSTNSNESTLKFTFVAENFNDEDKTKLYQATYANITVASVNNAGITAQRVFTFIRYNNNAFIPTLTTTSEPSIIYVTDEPQITDINLLYITADKGDGTLYNRNTDGYYYLVKSKDNVEFYSIPNKEQFLVNFNATFDKPLNNGLTTKKGLVIYPFNKNNNNNTFNYYREDYPVDYDIQNVLVKIQYQYAISEDNCNTWKLDDNYHNNITNYTVSNEYSTWLDVNNGWATLNLEKSIYGNVIEVIPNDNIYYDRRFRAKLSIVDIGGDEWQNNSNEYSQFIIDYKENVLETLPYIDVQAELKDEGNDNNDIPIRKIVWTIKRNTNVKIDQTATTWKVKVWYHYRNNSGSYTNSEGNTESATIENSPYIILEAPINSISYTYTQNIYAYKQQIVDIQILKSSLTYGFIYELAGGLSNAVMTNKVTGVWNIWKQPVYTFADAYIDSAIIRSWSDEDLTIEFHIQPGKYTKIQSGTVFKALGNKHGVGERYNTDINLFGFKFISGTESWPYTVFYDYLTWSATNWNNGCFVTIKMYNAVKTNQNDKYYTDEENNYYVICDTLTNLGNYTNHKHVSGKTHLMISCGWLQGYGLEQIKFNFGITASSLSMGFSAAATEYGATLISRLPQTSTSSSLSIPINNIYIVNGEYTSSITHTH